jgi:hypothetical protein
MHELAKLEAEYWQARCREPESLHPGINRWVERRLVEHKARSITFEIAREAAFLHVEELTGVTPQEQRFHPDIQRVRMALQSSVMLWSNHRLTQQVYDFDATLSEELAGSANLDDKDYLVDDEDKPIPADVLKQAPFASFVVAPNLEGSLRSFFVSIYEGLGAAAKNSLMMEVQAHLSTTESIRETSASVILKAGQSLREALDDFYRSMANNSAFVNLPAEARSNVTEGFPAWEAMYRLLRQALPFVLYLCAINKDVAGQTAAPPEPRKTKKGIRFFPAERPSISGVGVRIGSTLRAARARAQSNESVGEAGHKLQPHLRRRHWHTYWKGPRHDPARRERVLYFLSEIPVNMNTGEEPEPTVHPV